MQVKNTAIVGPEKMTFFELLSMSNKISQTFKLKVF